MINVSAGGKLRLLSGRSLDRSVEKEPRERRMNEKSPGAGEDRCNFSPAAQGEPVATCFIRVSPALRRELLKIASHEHSPSAPCTTIPRPRRREDPSPEDQRRFRPVPLCRTRSSRLHNVFPFWFAALLAVVSATLTSPVRSVSRPP